MSAADDKGALFSHFLVLRVQESIPPNPVSPVVTYHCASASASPFPPDCPAFAFADAPILRRRDDEEFPSESFTFVLTDSSGVRTYGYTRRFLPVGSVPRYPEALCILSTHAFPALFAELLEHLQIRWLLQPGAAFAMVEAALAAPLPRPGLCWPMAISSVGSAAAAVGSGKLVEQFVMARAEDSLSSQWPLLPISRHLSIDNLLLLLSALLCEQRVVFVSKHLSRLSDCIHAAVALLTPLQWQHILVPLLPRHLLNYCCAPMPFVIGLLDEYLVDLLAMPGLDEIIVVNLDANRVSTTRDVNTQSRAIEPGEELKPGRFAFPLPDEISAKLKKQLKSKDYGSSTGAAASASASAGSASSSDNGLQEQDFFEACLVFQMQLFASVDWSAPLDSRGKFVVDDFVARAETRCPQGHWFLEQIKHSQCVERFLQLGSERHAAGRAVTSGTAMSYADRFERMRQEVVAAAASSTPEKPYADLFSFSFVLKRIRAHLESVSAAQSAQAAQAVAQAVGSNLPRFLGETETRKLVLELTSNSPMSKQRSPADVLASLTLGSFDSRTLNVLLPVVWDRLADCKKKNSAHGHKGLILLEHLLHHGSDRVILGTLYAMQPQITLQSLAHTYTHEQSKTQELIRSCAGRIQTLLGNVFLLRKTRRYLRVCDLRRYRWMGALAGSASHQNQVSITLGPELFDPEFDEFRQRSLVEMMLPPLPPFNQLHARYMREFASPPAMHTPSALRGSNNLSPGSSASPETPGTQTAAQLSAANFATFAWDGPAETAAPAAATTVAPPSTVAATTMLDNFNFSGAVAAASGVQPPTVLAILPPAATTATAAPAHSAPAPAAALAQPSVARSQSGTPARPAVVHASIIDTSIFETVAPVPVPALAANPSTPVKKQPAAAATGAGASGAPSAAAAVSGSKPSPSAAPAKQLAAYASAPPSTAAAAAATTAAPPTAAAATTASASPWAAFDDAFSEPSPAPASAAALTKTPSQTSTTTASPARSNASTPALAPAASVAAPAAPAPVDPTAGLDLFFCTPAAAIAPPAAAAPVVAAPAVLASIGGVAAPVMTPEEIEKQRLRREKKAAKQAEGREAAAAAAAAAAAKSEA